jgi:hypothetical protein
MLLTRDQFRELVGKRDKYTCVVCSGVATAAHHIIERRLFSDGGYYLDNGASLCDGCHILAETTEISCDDLRRRCGITRVRLPEHLYDDQEYDKWGNPIFPNGTRAKGELFNDESVQKILKQGNMLGLFTDRIKYPRTYHLPWSPGRTKDDRGLEDCSNFEGKEVAVTLKMDGENTTMYRDYIHARSLTSENHSSRDRVKAIHASIAHDIPEGWRICGENLYAKHSIKYDDLRSYFLVFSIWDENNVCLPWNETVNWSFLLGLETVETLYTGPYSEKAVRESYLPYDKGNEGYVVRLHGSFHYSQFRKSVAKYVRKDHVHTHGHWMRQAIEPNQLK